MRKGGRSREIRESLLAAFSSEGSEVDQPRGEGKGSRGLESWTQDVIWVRVLVGKKETCEDVDVDVDRELVLNFGKGRKRGFQYLPLLFARPGIRRATWDS